MSDEEDVFESVEPNPTQAMQLEAVRKAAKAFGIVLNANMPNGPDKTFAMRTLRTALMWASVAITKNPDGTPRREGA